MPRTKIVQHPNEFPFDDHQKDLLLIADLPSRRTDHDHLLLREAKRILRVARAIESLARLVVLREWDRVFLIVGARVFMRFPADDLLAAEREDIGEVASYLADFNRWRDARQLLVVHGEALEGAEPFEGEERADFEAARATLAEFRSRLSRSGDCLDDLFSQWVRARAFVHPFDLMAGVPEGACTQSIMPAKMKILATLTPEAIGPDVKPDPRHDVRACVPSLWITTVTGRRYLVRCNAGDPPIKRGQYLIFCRSAETLVRQWRLVP